MKLSSNHYRALAAVWLLGAFLMAFLLPPEAVADYMLAPAREQYFVLTDHWSITPIADSLDRGAGSLSVDQNKRKYTWDIDAMWLADRINSDSICTGSYKQEMQKYLHKINQRAEQPLCVELVTLKQGGPLFVAGIWTFDPKKSFERVHAPGYPVYGLTGEQVKALPNDSALDAAVRKQSKEAWQKLTTRLANK